MKRYLLLICFALVPFFSMDKAAANLLLEKNPTPLEPVSLSASGESYQVARVQFLPDYLRNMSSKRINDGGKTETSRQCTAYGFVSSCGADARGTLVKPFPGLTCYKNCVSCVSAGYVKQCPSPQVGTAFNLPNGLPCYKNCQCPSTYNRTTKIVSNANCSSCSINGTTKWKCECWAGYKLNGNNCEKCDAYQLASCPSGCNCSTCPDNSSKFKIDSAKTAEGWNVCSNQTKCCAVACPAGFTAGVTSCASGSTKPDLTLNGWSGGQKCGMCSCKNVNTACTASAYPLTSVPANANYETCNTGCGSEKVVRYKITSCKANYKLSNGACKYDVCTTAGYSKSACTSSQKQTGTTYTEAGTTCYLCKNDICTSGYSKTACNSSQKQTGSTRTDAGTLCYLCKNDTCATGYSKTACTSSQKLTGTSKTDAGTTCYTCTLKECGDYGYLASQPDGKVCDTTSPRSGLTCYISSTCKVPHTHLYSCPAGGYSTTQCSENEKQTGTAEQTCSADGAKNGVTCYKCQKTKYKFTLCFEAVDENTRKQLYVKLDQVMSIKVGDSSFGCHIYGSERGRDNEILEMCRTCEMAVPDGKFTLYGYSERGNVDMLRQMSGEMGCNFEGGAIYTSSIEADNAHTIGTGTNNSRDFQIENNNDPKITVTTMIPCKSERW